MADPALIHVPDCIPQSPALNSSVVTIAGERIFLYSSGHQLTNAWDLQRWETSSLKETNVVLRGQALVFCNRHNTRRESERRILNMSRSRKICQGGGGCLFFSHLHRPYRPLGPIAY